MVTPEVDRQRIEESILTPTNHSCCRILSSLIVTSVAGRNHVVQSLCKTHGISLGKIIVVVLGVLRHV